MSDRSPAPTRCVLFVFAAAWLVLAGCSSNEESDVGGDDWVLVVPAELGSSESVEGVTGGFGEPFVDWHLGEIRDGAPPDASERMGEATLVVYATSEVVADGPAEVRVENVLVGDIADLAGLRVLPEPRASSEELTIVMHPDTDGEMVLLFQPVAEDLRDESVHLLLGASRFSPSDDETVADLAAGADVVFSGRARVSADARVEVEVVEVFRGDLSPGDIRWVTVDSADTAARITNGTDDGIWFAALDQAGELVTTTKAFPSRGYLHLTDPLRELLRGG